MPTKYKIILIMQALDSDCSGSVSGLTRETITREDMVADGPMMKEAIECFEAAITKAKEQAQPPMMVARTGDIN